MKKFTTPSTFLRKTPLFVFYVIAMFFAATKSSGQTTTTVFSDNFNRGSVVTPLSAGGSPSITYTTATTATSGLTPDGLMSITDNTYGKCFYTTKTNIYAIIFVTLQTA
jgi:hypothetical protein